MYFHFHSLLILYVLSLLSHLLAILNFPLYSCNLFFYLFSLTTSHFICFINTLFFFYFSLTFYFIALFSLFYFSLFHQYLILLFHLTFSLYFIAQFFLYFVLIVFLFISISTFIFTLFLSFSLHFKHSLFSHVPVRCSLHFLFLKQRKFPILATFKPYCFSSFSRGSLSIFSL